MESLHLIVGLGNPGAEYARTRHNAGFMVVEQLAERWRAGWVYEKKFNARLARAECRNARVLLCEPQTYMNSSGEAIRSVHSYYDVPLGRMLVVVDDVDLPLGEIRMRAAGGSGGHHGLESIERHLSTNGFARQRIGIGRLAGARQVTDYVLGRFNPVEVATLGKVFEWACGQVESWLTAGIETAMNQFNGNRIARESATERREQ